MESVTNELTEASEWYNNGCITIAGHGHGCGRSDRRLITTNRRGLKVPPFLNKVYELVNDPKTNAIISWTSDGTSFTVWDHHMFTKNILPVYFRHDNFSSFVYQLNNYVSISPSFVSLQFFLYSQLYSNLSVCYSVLMVIYITYVVVNLFRVMMYLVLHAVTYFRFSY